MALRLWGCYSVADHLEERAFVSDLLLYDRLVVPVPAPDDIDRWEERWNPERQRRLLDILGGFVERMEWAAPLRDEFQREWSPADTALDIDDSAPDPTRAYELTRRIITEQLRGKVIDAGDVPGVAVYAKPDRFDREWKLSWRLPFVGRVTRVTPGARREVMQPLPLEEQHLAKLVVTRLAVPDDGRDDEEVLKRTVDLVARDDVARRRAAFHQLIASLEATGMKAETIVGEVEDLLDEFNSVIRRHTKAQRARVAVHCVTTAEGAAALWAPPVALATGPTAAAAEAMIQRRWGGDPEVDVSAVSLLHDAQQALR